VQPPQVLDLRDPPTLCLWMQLDTKQLLRDEEMPFRLGSHARGPASTPAGSSGLGDVVSPSLGEGQLGWQRPPHRQHWG